MSATATAVDDRVRFTEGDCWILAVEINRRDPSWKLARNTACGHAFCVKPDPSGSGWLAVDVDGVRGLTELLEEWDPYDPDWALAELEELQEWGPVDGAFPRAWERASELAQRLV